MLITNPLTLLLLTLAAHDENLLSAIVLTLLVGCASQLTITRQDLMHQAFATDTLVLALAQEAVRNGADQRMTSKNQKAFLYMPWMHSESPKIHREAVAPYNHRAVGT